MQNKKKIYGKPKLEPVKMLEVGALLCCRATIFTCSVANRNSKGKSRRGRDSS
ncbi:MAG: hypothetical protein AB1498_11635 [bacterium]